MAAVVLPPSILVTSAVVLSGLPGLMSQGQSCDAGRDVEAGIAFDAERLQRNRLSGAADQHVGAATRPDRSARSGTTIGSGQRAGRRRGGRRQHRPNEHAALCIADIDAELVDGSDIVLRRASHRRERAIDRLRRPEDEAKPAGHVTGECAGFYGLRLRRASRRQSAGCEAECTDRYREFVGHSIILPLAKLRRSGRQTSTSGHIHWFRAPAPTCVRYATSISQSELPDAMDLGAANQLHMPTRVRAIREAAAYAEPQRDQAETIVDRGRRGAILSPQIYPLAPGAIF